MRHPVLVVYIAKVASTLAVLNVSGESEYIGSFDLLLRVFATRAATYKAYHQHEIAFDLKLTGASVNLGLNSPTIRNILSHGQAVFKAARACKSNRLGHCKALAYLFRRPPGLRKDGKSHNGAWGFLLLDAVAFVSWNAKSNHPPPCLLKAGTFIRDGSQDELESLPMIAIPMKPKIQRDRWAELRECQVKPGWVKTLDFVKIFKASPNTRKTNENVLKQLRAWLKQKRKSESAELADWREPDSNAGRPPKMARMSTLQQCFSELR